MATDYLLTAPFLDPKTSARSQIPTAIYDRLNKPPQKPYKTKKLTQIHRPATLPFFEPHTRQFYSQKKNKPFLTRDPTNLSQKTPGHSGSRNQKPGEPFSKRDPIIFTPRNQSPSPNFRLRLDPVVLHFRNTTPTDGRRPKSHITDTNPRPQTHLYSRFSHFRKTQHKPTNSSLLERPQRR